VQLLRISCCFFPTYSHLYPDTTLDTRLFHTANLLGVEEISIHGIGEVRSSTVYPALELQVEADLTLQGGVGLSARYVSEARLRCSGSRQHGLSA
jgi:hypothetical protein